MRLRVPENLDLADRAEVEIGPIGFVAIGEDDFEVVVADGVLGVEGDGDRGGVFQHFVFHHVIAPGLGIGG